MEYIIYKLTNQITGKSYIGITTNLNERLAAHRRCAGNCRYLHNSIKKYGWINFKCEIIDKYVGDDIRKVEGKYIILYNTLAPSGYNLVEEDIGERRFSKETLERKSKAAQKRDFKHGSSGFIGVDNPRGNDKKYYMHIRKAGICYGKYFNSVIDAAEAYDRLAIYFNGPNARVNFIDNIKKYLTEDLEKFFKFICNKHKKSSKYPFIWFHRGSKGRASWDAAWKLPSGKLQYLGTYKTEDDAYHAQQQFIKTGVYKKRPLKESRISNPYAQSLGKLSFIYYLKSPFGQLYEVMSVRYFAEDFGLDKYNLLYTWYFHRPASRGKEAGWQIVQRLPVTAEKKDEYRNSISQKLWKPINSIHS